MAKNRKETDNDGIGEPCNLLEIDPNELDQDWIKQPKHVFNAMVDLADKKKDLEDEKNSLAIRHAEIGNDVRVYPAQYDIEKITEKVVEAAILLSEDYQKALRKYNTAKHAVDIASAWVTALEHKKRALESMVKLFGMEYFSAPRADAENHEAVEEMKRKATRRKGRKKIQ